MRRTAPRFALVWAVLSCAACVSNMNWKTVKSNPAPARFAIAPDGTIWGYGAVVMHRAANRTWSNVDVCGQYGKSGYYSGQKQETDLAFVGSTTWVLCGNTTLEGQVLLRYDGTQATVIPLPNDQDLQLAQLDSGVALIGKQHLYQQDGDLFSIVAAAPAPPSYAGFVAAGHSISDLYTGSFPQIAHWNGTAWVMVTPPVDNGTNGFRLNGSPFYRSGHVYAGGFELSGETATPVVRDSPGLARNLTAFAVLGPDEAVFIGRPPTSAEVATNTAYFWYGKNGDADFTFMGDAPFFSGSLYEAGGQSGFAIDEHTLLVVNLSSATSADLEEGVE